MDEPAVATIYFMKLLLINACVYISFIKMSNIKETKKINTVIITISSFIVSLISSYIKFEVNLLLSILILILLYGFVLGIVSRMKFGYSLIITVIAYAICLICFILSMIIEYFPYKIMYNIFGIENDYFNLLIIAIIQFMLVYAFFKIKKFKNGFDFLNSKLNNDFIDIIIIDISTVVILMYCLTGSYHDTFTRNLLIAFLIFGITMFITIQKTFTMYYKQKLMKQTLEEYESDIKEKDAEIERLKNEKFNISKITHEFYNRQKALELAVQDKISNKDGNFNEETSGELGALDRIKDLTDEYSEKLKSIKTLTKLQLTEIPEIDNMFKYMQTECDKNNIEFRLKIVGGIFPLVNHIIPKNKLETMIGDHIRDAIIAINYSETEDREILVILGMKNNKYELSIYDTGIEFEIETLLKLGLEPATTHKDSGGSGIGFITTFETLKETKASLIIKEETPSDNRNYTKCVTIRFDNKHQYKICSYRADEIKNANKGGRKIILEKLEN